MSTSSHYAPHPSGRGQTSFRRGGSDYGFCHVHRKKRTRADLIPSPEWPGKWKCLPHKECRTELVTCRRHGRTRNPAQMKQIAPGVWECTSNMECRGPGIQPSQSSGSLSAGGVRSGIPGGTKSHGDGELPFRPSHPHYRHHGGTPFAWSPLPQGGSSSTTHPPNISRPAVSQSVSGAGSGVSTGGGGEGSSAGAEDGVSRTNATNSQRLCGVGGSVGEGRGYPFLAVGVRRDRQGKPISSSDDKMLNCREQLLERRGGHPDGTLFSIRRTGKLTSGGVPFFVSHPTGWCVLHGKRIRLVECRAEEEHFPICADPSICLSTPLDLPRELASRGCDEVLCSRHRTLRSVAFMELTSDRQGYQCLSAHRCLFLTSTLSLGSRQKQDEEESFDNVGRHETRDIGTPQVSLMSTENEISLLDNSSSVAITEKRGNEDGVDREENINWFMDGNNGQAIEIGEDELEVGNDLPSSSDGRLLFFGVTDEIGGGMSSSSSAEDASFFYS